MVLVTINVNLDNYISIGEKIPEIKKRGLNLSSQTMLNRLQRISPVDEGLLRQWFFYNISADSIEIRTPAPYAPFVNDGTGIYGPRKTPIYSKKIGKPLAFEVGGKMVFVRMIRGQKPQKFVERSIEYTQNQLENIFIKSVRDVMT